MVALDLSRLNRIIEVNDQLNYAVIEPGVTFFDLFEHIQDKGLKLWMSVPALGLGLDPRQCAGPRLRHDPDG